MLQSRISTGRAGDLHGLIWRSETVPVERVLLCIHGLGDHGGTFASVAEHFTDQGYAVAAIDLPGHGRSPGPRGKVDSYDSLLDEIAHSRVSVSESIPGLPHVLLGHSMGGNLVVNYALRADEFVACSSDLIGQVLCAPVLLSKNPPPRPQIFAAWLTGLLLRGLCLTKPVAVDQLTRDPQRAEAIRTDPLRHSRVSLYLATQILSQGRWALDQARSCALPTLVLAGTADSLIDVSACGNLALRMGSEACSIDFPDMRHDLFGDIGRENVLAQLTLWLQQALTT